MHGPVVTEEFWLPRALREEIYSQAVWWQEVTFTDGQECSRESEEGTARAVMARWPVLTQKNLKTRLHSLAEARRRAPRETSSGLACTPPCGLFRTVGQNPLMPCLRTRARQLWKPFLLRGYSAAMVGSLVRAPALWELGKLAAAFKARPT